MRASTIFAAALVTALSLAATTTRALVGPASDGGPLESYIAMILSRAPGIAGFCSGVVIRRDVVLTAAHCVSGVGDTRVYFRDTSGAPILLLARAVATHPRYRAGAVKTRERSIDLALVRTRDPLPERFRVAALDEGSTPRIGDRFRLAGFGLGREGVASTGGVARWGYIAARAPLSSILLWAEDPNHAGLSACAGDSGAPIFARDADSVIAIAAWSAGGGKKQCGALTQGVLIAPQRAWIDDVTRNWDTR